MVLDLSFFFDIYSFGYAGSSLHYAGLLVVACRLLDGACGI